VAAPDDIATRRTSDTVLIVLALMGAATPIAVTAFARNRFWHEGFDGFVVAVVCSVVVAARSEPGTWQQRLAKILIVLAVVTVAIAVALGVLLVVAISKHGFTGSLRPAI